MHNRKEPDYTDFIADFLKDMQETIDIAKKQASPMRISFLIRVSDLARLMKIIWRSSTNWNACIRSAIRSCLELPENP